MKTAMIWGANGGIGHALLQQLAAEQWTTVAISRDQQQTAALATYSYEADVTNEFAVQNVVRETAMEVEKIDLWIYAAGDITSGKASALEVTDWTRILNANLTGAYVTAHHSFPLLAPDASLYFLGAVSERLRLPGLSAYAAAKAGLEAFAETLRKEERQRRIVVVRPGAVATSFWEKVPLRLPQDAAPPEKVAGRIITAYQQNHTGHLDLI